MRKDLILAVDQNTSATKAVRFDSLARIVYRTTVEYRQYYPRPGWIEHDAEEIFHNTEQVLLGVVRQTSVDARRISALADYQSA